jgi:hypothetical protein
MAVVWPFAARPAPRSSIPSASKTIPPAMAMPAPPRMSKGQCTPGTPGTSPPGPRTRSPPWPAAGPRTAPGQSRPPGRRRCGWTESSCVRGLLTQHRVGDHLIGPGPIGNGLGHVRQPRCGPGGHGLGCDRQDAPGSGHDVDDGERGDGDDGRRQEQVRQRGQDRCGGRRDLVTRECGEGSMREKGAGQTRALCPLPRTGHREQPPHETD